MWFEEGNFLHNTYQKEIKSYIYYNAHNSYINDISFSPNGRYVVSASDFGSIKLWDFAKRSDRDFLGHDNAVNSVAFSPNGGLLLSGCSDGTIRIWDARTGETIKNIEAHGDSVSSVAWAPDGLKFLSGSKDKSMRVWELPEFIKSKYNYRPVNNNKNLFSLFFRSNKSED